MNIMLIIVYVEQSLSFSFVFEENIVYLKKVWLIKV